MGGRMAQATKRFHILAGSLLIFLFFPLVSAADADDELILHGIPKSVDVGSSTAVIEVRSGSCPGSIKFKVEDAEFLFELIDKKISFRVNANSCRDGQVLTARDFVVRSKGGRP